jgi:RNA polymerase sigma-70 factor (ECF subfamily)
MPSVDGLTVLARGAVDGDDVALAELVRRTQRTVEGVCRVLADAEDVEDVVQEVYLRVVTALPRFRFDSPVLPWMLAITRRTCADVVRRRRRRRGLLARSPAQPGREVVPAVGCESVEAADLLAGLDRDRRTAFVLTQLLGLSYEEAAAVCGCPVGTVRSRVARARADLAGAVRRADSA